MTPDFKIIANDKDITKLIKSRLLSLDISDYDGFTSDRVEILIADPDNQLSLPKTGAKLLIYMGYTDIAVGLTFMGLFNVVNIDIIGFPNKIRITAHAADMKQQLKSQKTRSWPSSSLADIIKTIANEHHLSPKISKAAGDVLFNHLDQRDESDLHFLTRITKELNYTFKIAADSLILIEKGRGKNISGDNLPAINIKKQNLKDFQCQIGERSNFLSVIAKWYDKEKAVETIITAGAIEPSFTIKKRFSNAETARLAAVGKLDQFKRGKSTLSLGLANGWPNIHAEGNIVIDDLHDEINGKWVVKSVKHSLSNSGFTTNIDAIVT